MSDDLYDFTGVSLDLEQLRSELLALRATTDRHVRLFNQKRKEEEEEEWYPPTPPIYDVTEKLMKVNRTFWEDPTSTDHAPNKLKWKAEPALVQVRWMFNGEVFEDEPYEEGCVIDENQNSEKLKDVGSHGLSVVEEMKKTIPMVSSTNSSTEPRSTSKSVILVKENELILKETESLDTNSVSSSEKPSSSRQTKKDKMVEKTDGGEVLPENWSGNSPVLNGTTGASSTSSSSKLSTSTRTSGIGSTSKTLRSSSKSSVNSHLGVRVAGTGVKVNSTPVSRKLERHRSSDAILRTPPPALPPVSQRRYSSHDKLHRSNSNSKMETKTTYSTLQSINQSTRTKSSKPVNESDRNFPKNFPKSISHTDLLKLNHLNGRRTRTYITAENTSGIFEQEHRIEGKARSIHRAQHCNSASSNSSVSSQTTDEASFSSTSSISRGSTTSQRTRRAPVVITYPRVQADVSFSSDGAFNLWKERKREERKLEERRAFLHAQHTKRFVNEQCC